jgi:hypothetical protein
MFSELFAPEVIETTDVSELLRVWDPQRLEVGIKAFAHEYSRETPSANYYDWVKQHMESIAPTPYPFWFTVEGVSPPDGIVLDVSVEEWRDVSWLFVQAWHIRMKLKFISEATAKWCTRLWDIELQARACAKAVHDT